MRMTTDTTNIIRANEEVKQIENGISKNHLEVKQEDKLWIPTWIDTVAEYCDQRKIEIKGKYKQKNKVLRTVSVIDYARMYVKEKNIKKHQMRIINHVRLHKQVYVPFEIVSKCGKEKTSCLIDNEEISPIKWWFCKERVEKPSNECFRKWNKFVRWLMK